MNETLLTIGLIITVILVAIVGIATSVIKGEQANCTTTRLSSTSFVVCTFNDQILYSGEVKNE